MSEAFNHNSTTPEAEKDLAQTPVWFVDAAQKFFNKRFTLDVCALPQTAKCERFYSLERGQDALKLPWGEFNWCNPPYSDITPWVDAAYRQSILGCTSALLVPDKPEVGYMRQARRYADTVIHMPFRLKFLRPNGEKFLDKQGKEQGPKFPVALILFTPWGCELPVRDEYIDFRQYNNERE